MVYGLQSFMERNCAASCIPTDIRELISKFKKDNNVADAIIVINLRGLLRNHTYTKDNSWMFGGQLKELVETCIQFVKSFEAVGAKLVFFDGYLTDTKFPIWLERRTKGLYSAEETLDDMERGQRIASFEGCQKLIPSFFVDFTKHVYKHMCNCEVFTCSRECDEAVADYARTNKCFAILGRDSDYVIYNAAKYYLTTGNLQMKTMTTVRYDSEVLAKKLSIPVETLPLLGTLLGNDVISRDDLKAFHKVLGKKQINRKLEHYPAKVVVEAVAGYVRQFRNMAAVYESLPRIARDVFGVDGMQIVVKASIDSYVPFGKKEPKQEPDLDSEWDDIKSVGMKLVAEVKSFKDVMPAMTEKIVKLGATLESFRRKDLPQSSTVTLPLRRRFYGVVLFEKPDGPGDIEEWSNVRSDEPTTVEPILPDEELHPGLLALWDEERVDIADVRWELFAHSVAPTLSVDLLKQLPQILVIPAAILFYLREHIPVVAVEDSGYLEDWELKALAVQAVRVETTELSEIADIVIEAPYNIRAIRLASIFMRAVTQMLVLLAACGFPFPMEQAMPWHYFDGKMFHQTYKQMKAGSTCTQLCGDKMPLFEQLLEIVLPEKQA